MKDCLLVCSVTKEQCIFIHQGFPSDTVMEANLFGPSGRLENRTAGLLYM